MATYEAWIGNGVDPARAVRAEGDYAAAREQLFAAPVDDEKVLSIREV